MAIPIALAYISPITAFAVYGVVVGAIILSTMMGRWETVMVWVRDPDETTDEQPAPEPTATGRRED